MLISDLLGQYYNSTNNGQGKKVSDTSGTQAVQRLVSSLRDMGAGTIFEGTINSMEGGKVMLGLSNGQQIAARLDANISLAVGQSMFFQVKTNDGAQIAIRPFTVDGNSVNLTLLHALGAAKLPATGANLSMVNTMMQEQMPIDAASLARMARTMNANPGINVQTLVQMQKFGIPINEEMAAQFENYMDDKQAITRAVDSFINELPQVMADASADTGTLRQMNAQVLTIITDGFAPGSEDGAAALRAEGKSPQIENGAAVPLENFQMTGAVDGGDGQTVGVKDPLSAAASGAQADLDPALARAAAAEAEVIRDIPETADGKAAAPQNGETAATGTDRPVNLTPEAAESGAQAGQSIAESGAKAAQAGADIAENGSKTAESGTQAAQAGSSVAESGAQAAQAGSSVAESGAQAGQSIAESGARMAADGAPLAESGAKTAEGAQQPETASLDGAQKMPDQPGVSHLLNEKQMQNLSNQLKALPGLAEKPELFADGKLRADATSQEILQAVKEALQSDKPMAKEAITRLFGGKEFPSLIKDSLEQQWMVKPQDVAKEGNRISALYEKLENQMSRMEEVVKATGHEHPQFSQAASEVRSNVDFMNHLNQAYTYAQIPLKMSGQNASGELFVYTNKKSLSRQQDRELTAFLHLDLENLGSTDVSVRMKNKDVSTDFYLEDDQSYALVRENLPKLEARLNKLGYQCTFSVTNESKKVNFVEDFLKKDQPSAGQQLHRYSFDMRA